MERWLPLPLDAAAHGPDLDRLTGWVHLLMLVLFVGWTAFFVVALVRFRASRQPTAARHGRGRLGAWAEIGVVVAEVALLFGVAVPLWSRWSVARDRRPAPGALEIRVVAEQFAWNVHYPGRDGRFGRTRPELAAAGSNPLGLDATDPAAADDVVTINQLHLAANRPVFVRLTSKDVVHSFFLPYLRVKQDAIPGQEIPVAFTPTMATPPEGRFPACAATRSCWEIACAQLCGNSHYRMKGYLVVESEAELERWLAAQPPAVVAAPAAVATR